MTIRTEATSSTHLTQYIADSPVGGADAPNPSLLEPAPVGSLPLLGQLHLLMIKANHQKRDADRKAEEQFEAEEAAADAQRIQEMKEKADKALFTGLVSAGLQIASAVGSSIAIANELSAMSHRDAKIDFAQQTAGTEAAKGAKDAAEASKRALDHAGATTKLVEGNCKAIDGARTGLDALGRSQAGDSDKKIAELESQSKAARRSADRLQSEQEATRQAEAKILQLAKEIADAQAACERAALLRV